MEASLNIDRVIGEAFALLRRNLLPYGALALLLVALPNFLAGAQSSGTYPLFSIGGFAQLWRIFWLGAALTGFVFNIVFLHTCLVELEQGEGRLADSFAVALRLFFPLLGASILSWLAMMLGFVALIVPGLMIFCTLSVALPALIREDLGVIASFSRSSELTRGQRWRIFVIFLVLWVLQAIATGAGTVFVNLGGTSAQGQAAIAGLVAAGVALLEAPIAASLYVELRNIKEGGVTDGLVAVFE